MAETANLYAEKKVLLPDMKQGVLYLHHLSLVQMSEN